MRIWIRVLILLCITTLHVSAQPNKTTKSKGQSPRPEEPVTFQIEHQNISTDTQNKPNTRPPRWYTSAEWWLFIATVGTLIAIACQARESAKATKAMLRSIKLQEIGLRQWVDVENWKTGPTEFFNYTVARTGGKVLARPESVTIEIFFDVVNGSPRPLAVQKVFTDVHIEGRKGWQNSVSTDKSLVPPEGKHPITVQTTLVGDEIDRYILNKLLVSVSGRVFYKDGMGDENEQPFTQYIECGISGAKFTTYLGKAPTQKDQAENS
jgi:hypothetical protein